MVLVKNAGLVDFTGRKWTDKLYIWHTGRGTRQLRAGPHARPRDTTLPAGILEGSRSARPRRSTRWTPSPSCTRPWPACCPRTSCARWTAALAACTSAAASGPSGRRAYVCPQRRLCKLLLYPGEEHDLQASARLVPWEPPPRNIRRSEGLFELPPDFVPLNRQAYNRRFGALLSPQQQAQLQRLPASVSILQAGRA